MMKNLMIFTLLFSGALYGQDITTSNITNITYTPIPQYELPKNYLIDNHSTLYPKENPYRRADIVFFLSLPVTMFLVQNIINVINILNFSLDNYNSDLGRDNFGYTDGEWNFIISALVMIPVGVMVYDTVYVHQYPATPFFKQENFKESRVDFNMYRLQF